MRNDKTIQHLGVIVLMAIGLTLGGCAASYDAAEAAGGDASPNNASVEGNDVVPEDVSLFDRDLQTARSDYARILESNPADGQAAAGHAVTDLLLLPYADATTTLLQHFGAVGSLNADGDVIYGDSGLLYFIARGVPWEDTGPDTIGIKSLLIDRLPWTREELDSVDGFVDGLDKPVDDMAEDLVKFAGRLDAVKADIDTALADPDFRAFFVPGEVFHDETFDINVGRGELALLRASLSGVQTAIYFFASYEHDWTLRRAFGTTVWEDVIADPEHPDYMEGWTTKDYQAAHLNESFLRSIGRPMVLRRAQQSFGDTIASIRQAIEFGTAQEIETALSWQAVSQDTAQDLIDFLAAVEAAATGPSELPFTEPKLTVDLTPVFVEGRTLPMETDAFLVTRYENEFGATETSIEFDEAAMEALTQGAFDPPYGSEPAPELSTAEAFESFYDALTNSFTTDVERTISGSF